MNDKWSNIIFMFCPTIFFWKSTLTSKEIGRAEHEYINIYPPTIHALISSLIVSGDEKTHVFVFYCKIPDTDNPFLHCLPRMSFLSVL